MLQVDSIQLLLNGLNEEQRRAVTAPDGPTVVFAGPGSGKTTVLTRRVLYLLERGIPARQLMVVTFTRAAAKEMKERLQQIMPEKVGELSIGTFHSLFLSMLREDGAQIPLLLQAAEQTELVRRLLAERDQPTDDETVASFLNQIGLCKGNLIFPARMKVQKEKNVLFRDVYRAYEAKKEQLGCWDYDDILVALYQRTRVPETLAKWQERYQHVLVDEFQDINRVQYEILLKLTGKHQRLFVVGDDDQSIYGFRGSDPAFMLELAKHFPSLTRIVLSVNYRSTDEIIRLGERLIRNNRSRQPKPRAGTGTKGPEPFWLEPDDEEDEAEQILEALKDGMETAVLYRTSTQARALIDALVRKGIPFFVSAGEHSFYQRWQVQDILAYIRLSYHPNDLDSLIRIVNKPKRYLFGDEWIDAAWNTARKGDRTLLEVLPELPGLEAYQVRYLNELRTHVPRIRKFSASEAVRYIRETIGYDRYLEAFAKETGNDPASLFEPADELVMAARHASDGQALVEHAEKVIEWVRHPAQSPRVKLMTFHKSKGLEFDRVFLIGLHAMVLPHRRSLQVPDNRKQAAWEEERRLFYVGITRARSELYLSVSKKRQGKRVGASPFVKEIGYDGEMGSAKSEIAVAREAPAAKSPVLHKPKAAQPQLRFAKEEVSPGMRLVHVKFGQGTVIQVTPLQGVAPGRKILIRFSGQTQTLHYELSRQLGLLSREA
ncbi:ATP-dependent helicase [Lihuaxuella thermophila]|uniref:DNA 3'-5' helicase n=1 Tax=Lihuaxuella thermophila TaxID=1173111 RepID=A0A1H8F7H9_9BACL|nr:ATP-dependent helicase [Lihuaxuella thermophila]SEN26998.1 DNA helicase-2 / ATP-dependent DNA helicase PcrA [Lihuaxuella thermophila]